ncbi:MAG: hypothetical protein KKE62_03365 [Proteobacteria bacterium]|nr:hypothetical protein [Pseudomonadota bacterium]MBU1388249.1 hypothetical protein [Pseudomonadota bacterium]MBU1541862.1 hypothetical protein [Pseudomonadota bacterium]MBU2479617.1 hypothetical protein [Pseudomonadota bacterium]
MKKRSIGWVLALCFLWASTAAAAFYSESLIYAGPPNYEYTYDDGNGPTQVSFEMPGNSHASAGWWSLGGDLATTWGENFQGWRYVFVSVEKELIVTAAGSAAIHFSFNGFLQVSGSTSQNGDYSLWADAEIYDDTPDPDNFEYWYQEMDEPGQMDISETYTFNYLFTEGNIGDIITLYMIFQTQVSPNNGVTPVFKDGESLSFVSSLQDSLKIDRMAGGIAAVDGPELSPSLPVPVSSSVWLVSIALAMVFGIKKKL